MKKTTAVVLALLLTLVVLGTFVSIVLDLLGGLLQLHGAQLGDHGLCLLAGRMKHTHFFLGANSA